MVSAKDSFEPTGTGSDGDAELAGFMWLALAATGAPNVLASLAGVWTAPPDLAPVPADFTPSGFAVAAADLGDFPDLTASGEDPFGFGGDILSLLIMILSA